MVRTIKLLPFVVSALLMIGSYALAQKSSGEILGVVTDPSGSVVSGVSITITNTATNESRRATTDGLGNYRVPFVLPGIYNVKAEMASFKTAITEGLAVRVDEQRRQDIVLQVGEVTQEVTIEANAVTVNAETPTLGNIIEQRRMVELPLNGRSFLSLAYLSAGAVQPGVGNVGSTAAGLSGGRPGVSVSISGLREGSNDILFDGVPSKHNFYSAVATQPPPEAISEFKVQQGYFSPEYGLPAVVNVVTKSGTNEFHGAAWEFLRNDALNARNTFDLRKVPTRENQYGVAAGAPILKDKLFVFGSYEGQKIRRSSTGRYIVPTPAMLQGDFSALLPTRVIYDPATFDANTGTRQPFPGNIIPAARIGSFAKTYLSNGLIPEPTGIRDGVFNRIVTTRLTQNDYKYGIRGDWSPRDSDKIFGRLSYSDSQQQSSAVIPWNGTRFPFVSRNIASAWTHIFGAKLVNDLRFGLDRAFLNTAAPEGSPDAPDWPTKLGLKNLNSNPRCNGATSVNLVQFGAFGHTFQNCIDTGNINYHFVDNLAYTTGRHSLNIGGQFSRIQLNDLAGFNQTGAISYTGQFTGSGTVSGSSAADFLLDAPFTATGGGTGTRFRRGNEWNVYFNDNFKLTRNLTLNFGLRYQYVSPMTDRDDLQATFDFKTGNILVAGKDGRPRTIIQKDRNDFAPRFGFAWSPGGSDKWALRGSYGIYYDRIPGNQLLWSGLYPPVVSGINQTSNQRIPTINVSTLFPPTPTDPNLFDGNFLFNIADRRSAYIQQWTLSLQRTLPWQVFVEAAYVGSKGTKLSKRIDSNLAPLPALTDTRPLQQRRPYPRFGFILDDHGFGNSSYNAMQLTLRKSFSDGLVFQGAYTWAKSLDQGDWGDIRNYRYADLDKGRSTWDLRNRFVFNASYTLPFGKNLTNTAGKLLVRGWEVNSIITLQSGAPFTVVTSGDPSDTGANFNKRPLRTCDGALPSGDRTRQRWFDTSCFRLPAFRTYGNSGSQIWDGPGTKNLDFSLNKSFAITEHKSLQFRSEFFNAFNFTNLRNPNTTVESAQFGRISGAFASRVIQFGLKFVW